MLAVADRGSAVPQIAQRRRARSLARCGSRPCSCGCASKAKEPRPPDGLDAALRRAVAGRATSADGLDAAVAVRATAGPAASARPPLLQRLSGDGTPVLDGPRCPAGLVRMGSRGSGVSEVQDRLNHAGADPQLAVDAIFGPLTKRAAVAFQASSGLSADGIVGPLTCSKLGAGGGPAPKPACADGAVSEITDPLPAVPPFTFSVMSQPQLISELDKQRQAHPKTPLGASQPSFDRDPFKGLPDQGSPVTVSAVPADNGDCVKCVADWQLPVAWQTLIASGAFVLDEPKRFFVSRAGDVSGCPPRSLPRLLEVRELITPEALPFIIAGEREHYLDFVRAFQIVGGRYLANVRRLTADRTHLRARDASECEAKVQNFLVRALGIAKPGVQGSNPTTPAPPAPGPAKNPVPATPLPSATAPAGTAVDFSVLSFYHGFFIDDFLALYLAPDRDRVPDGPHQARPRPPTDRPPTLPNIDTDVNPFGCDAFARKLTAIVLPRDPRRLERAARQGPQRARQAALARDVTRQRSSWMRIRLPAGSRIAQSRTPYGCSIGSWTTSASLACKRSKVSSRSLVARLMAAKVPLAIISAIVRRSSSVMPGSTAGGCSTIDGPPAGPTVIQRSPL